MSQKGPKNHFMTSLENPAAAQDSKKNSVAPTTGKPMNKGHLLVCLSPSATTYPASQPPSPPHPQKTPHMLHAPCQLILTNKTLTFSILTHFLFLVTLSSLIEPPVVLLPIFTFIICQVPPCSQCILCLLSALLFPCWASLVGGTSPPICYTTLLFVCGTLQHLASCMSLFPYLFQRSYWSWSAHVPGKFHQHYACLGPGFVVILGLSLGSFWYVFWSKIAVLCVFHDFWYPDRMF